MMGKEMWGGEEVVQKRADEAEGTLTDVLKFFTTRAQLEDKYAKSVGGISSKAKIESGTLGLGWQSMRDQQNQQLSLAYSVSAAKTTSEIVGPLEGARKKFANDRARLANDIAQLKKEMQRRTALLQEKKQSYWGRCESHFRDKKKLDELPPNAPASKLAKVQGTYQKAKADMELAEKEYRDYIVEYNSFKAKYEEALRAFLNEHQQMDIDRLRVLAETLQKYANMTEESCRDQQSFFKAFREQLITFSASMDMNGTPSLLFFVIHSNLFIPFYFSSFLSLFSFHSLFLLLILNFLSLSTSPSLTLSPVDFLSVIKEIPPEPDQYVEYGTSETKGVSRSDRMQDDTPTGYSGLPPSLGALPELWTFALALFDFPGTDENDLRFRKGDVIVVRTQHESGWWVGEMYGRCGMFPAAYVEIVRDRKNLPRRWPPPNLRSCTAKISFNGTEDTDLSISEGEVLVITGDAPGWFTGENNRGDQGIFPKDFVTLNEIRSMGSGKGERRE